MRYFLDSARDLAAIVAVIAFFQLVVLQQPIPNLGEILTGVILVMLGLTFFIRGLEMGLFPIGESMAYDFENGKLVGVVSLTRMVLQGIRK